MSYIGIPITINTPDEKGDYVNVERAVFATIRKCTELSSLLKEINTCDIKEDASAIRVQSARKKLIEATTEEEIQIAEDLAIKAVEHSEDCTQRLASAVRNFIVKGFMGAGYTEPEAQRYADLMPPERLRELKASCLVGSGRLDFTIVQAVKEKLQIA